jgi:very-short-patch-repair endonuclease
MITKICNRCKVEKDLNEDNFPTYFTRISKEFKFRNICKICFNLHTQNYRIKKFGPIKAYYELFIEECIKFNKDKYDYSLIDKNINSESKIKIICKIHGEFIQRARSHKLKKSQCPKCSYLGASKGEQKINNYLIKNNFVFDYEKVFFGQSLSFDFYIEELNLCIEYDGEHHYNEKCYSQGIESLRLRQERDERKNKYCKNKGINLLRIPYWEFNNIEILLNNKMLEIKKNLEISKICRTFVLQI